ncbi:MAG: AAA family ATPase [Helicobacteraceae bacterium]|jgi:DNA helicase IV|nr:AAA family ATPase [Helicobacteraceae bacterium]
MDDYQRRVINARLNRSLIVTGCAGSGKSIIALWKAKEIQEKNMGTYIVIVFTKALRRYISDGIKQIGINERNVYYMNEWLDKQSPGADYIIVDEAQDFSKAKIEMFKAKARRALMLFGDSAQQLYKFIKPPNNPISMYEIAGLTNFPMENLVFNHRLPKTIARFAQYIIAESDDLVDRCKQEGYEKPQIIKRDSFEAQLDAVVEIIVNRKFEDVGILFMRNVQVQRAYDYFLKKHPEMLFEAKYNNDNEANIGVGHMDINFQTTNPKIITYHSAKGLQFEAVFLPDCASNNKNPLYVAVTRTYQSLYILHSGNLSQVFDTIPTNCYDKEGQTSERILRI